MAARRRRRPRRWRRWPIFISSSGATSTPSRWPSPPTDVLSDRLGAGDPSLAPVLADRARIALARATSEARKWAEAAVAIDRRNAAGRTRRSVAGARRGARRRGRFADSRAGRCAGPSPSTAPRATRSRPRAASPSSATLYLRQKRYGDALPLIEEAASIDQDQLGRHPSADRRGFPRSRPDLSRDQSRRRCAKVLRTAIDILERGAGRGTPTLGYVELDLARAEHALGHEDKARSLFNDARRILNAAEDEERDRQRQA